MLYIGGMHNTQKQEATPLTIDEVVEILDAMVADVGEINPRLSEALDLAALWLGMSDVKEIVVKMEEGR